LPGFPLPAVDGEKAGGHIPGLESTAGPCMSFPASTESSSECILGIIPRRISMRRTAAAKTWWTLRRSHSSRINFRQRARSLVIEWATIHQDELRAAFQKAQAMELPGKIAPLN